MEVKNNTFSYQTQFYNRSQKHSFKGLTSKLSKTVYDKDEVVKLYKQFESKSHGIIGKLPANWIYSIPFEKRHQMIKNILANFGEIFADLRGQKDNTISKTNASKKITKLLKEAGVLKGRETAKIKYIDSGSFADVYRLEVQKESYAIKLFKNLLIQGFHLDNINGNFYEQPIAQYMKGKIPKRNNNWFKFYFGDLKNGIMVSRFENGDYPFDGKKFRTEKIGILTYSEEHFKERNCIEGRSLDIGSVELLEHAKNKTLRYVYSKTWNDQLAPLKILKETLKWKHSQLYNERLKGVFYSMQIVSDENAKKCLDLLLPAADKEVGLYISNKIFYAPYTLRKDIFKTLYARNDRDIDKALAKNLEYIDKPLSSDSQYWQLLNKRNDEEINSLLQQISLKL